MTNKHQMFKLSAAFSGPHTWCRHVYLLRTTLRLCHKSSAGSAVQNHLEGVGYDLSPDPVQSAVHDQQGLTCGDSHELFSREVEDSARSYEPNISRAVGKFQDEQTQRYLLKPDQPPNSRVLKVAILGAPNAGKSTLVNSLLTWKVNPVSSKVHTTRKNSLAVLTEGHTQIVFTDTPGVITPGERKKHHCDRSLLVDPKRSVDQADLVGVLVDVANRATRGALHPEILKILEECQHIPSVLILNKVDELKKKDALLELIKTLTEGIVGGVRVAASPIRKSKKKKTEDARSVLSKLEEKYGKLTIQKNKAACLKEIDSSVTAVEQREGMKETFERTKKRNIENLELEFDDSITKVNELFREDDYKHNLSVKARELVIPEVKSKGDMQILQETSETESVMVDDMHSHEVPPKNQKDHSSSVVFTQSNKNSEEIMNGGKELEDEFSEMERAKYNLVMKDMGDKTFEGKQDLSKYKTPWDELMPWNREVRRGWPHFDRVFILSSLYGDGVMDLKTYFVDKAEDGDWEYHSSLVTDEDPQELAKQIVWSKCLDHLKGYIAYQLTPDITYWKVDEGTLKIVMNISVKHVEKLIGPAGAIIKQIAYESQQSLMDAFRCEVALKLVVKRILSKRR